MSEPIRPPANVGSDRPDKYTKKNPDFTGSRAADGRRFYFNGFVFSYGTDDKLQAAALLLTIIAFVSLIALFIVGLARPEAVWIQPVADNLFKFSVFTAGVALGRAGDSRQFDD